MTVQEGRPHSLQILPIIAASLYGVLVTTGALMLVLILAAVMSGSSVTDLFAEVFPRFRGGPAQTKIPGLAYAIFIIYTFVASTIAVLSRRRFTQRWLRGMR